MATQQKKPVPFDFVLENLEKLSPQVRPMFGCHAVYVKEKIIFILREKPDHTHSNGVWLATSKEHHASLKIIFPNLKSIPVLGSGVTGWQMLQSSDDNFESSVLQACEMVLDRDPRIGKIPQSKKSRASKKSRRKPSRKG